MTNPASLGHHKFHTKQLRNCITDLRDRHKFEGSTFINLKKQYRSASQKNRPLICICRSLICTYRSLICTCRSLICICRSLICICRSLICICRSLICICRSLICFFADLLFCFFCYFQTYFSEKVCIFHLRDLQFERSAIWEICISIFRGLGLRIRIRLRIWRKRN